MDIWLWRDPSEATYTLGQMFVDTHFECDTLEDVQRPLGEKVPGATAIPLGKYQVVVAYSPHFHRLMPHLLDVPYFTGILMHWGVSDLSTEGCIILGKRVHNPDAVFNADAKDLIVDSHTTFDHFFAQLVRALDSGEEAWITISSEWESAHVNPG
jgi:hypothetical protein